MRAGMEYDGSRDECRTQAIHYLAVEIVMKRRQPSHPELMQSDDAILNFISTSYPSCVHGLSTTLMVSMFRFEYMLHCVPRDELARIMSYVYSGRPVYRSANDGVRTLQTP